MKFPSGSSGRHKQYTWWFSDARDIAFLITQMMFPVLQFRLALSPSGEGGWRVAPAQEVVQYQSDARGARQQAAGWPRQLEKLD